MAGEKIALFDFCGTMINFQSADTYVRYVRSHVRKNPRMIFIEGVRKFLAVSRIMRVLQKFSREGLEIQPPESFGKMVEIGSQIAKLFRYVRIDFYDVDGHLYYGEITLHHGSGLNHFTPESYDLHFGDMLDLNAPVQEDI